MKAPVTENQKNKYGETTFFDDGTTLNNYSTISTGIKTNGIGKAFLKKLNKWLKKQNTFNVKMVGVVDCSSSPKYKKYTTVKPEAILSAIKKFKEPRLDIILTDREYSYNANADTYYRPTAEDVGTTNDQDNYYFVIYFDTKTMLVSEYLKEKFPEVLKDLHLTFAKHFNNHSAIGKRISLIVPKDGAIAKLIEDGVYPRHRVGFGLDKIVEKWSKENNTYPGWSGISVEMMRLIEKRQKITVPEIAKELGCTKKTAYSWIGFVKAQLNETHSFISGKGNKAGEFVRRGVLNE